MKTIVAKQTPSISLETTRRMQEIGLDAWNHAMGVSADGTGRSMTELLAMYDPTTPARVRQAQIKYKTWIESGGHVLTAHSAYNDDGKIIGFLLAKDDVSGSTLTRLVKRAKGQKPYAWLAQVNVDPAYQKQGVASELVRTGLEFFEPDQTPTAYVFDENKLMIDMMASLGFKRSPLDQEGELKHDYFGENHDPVTQFRFEANSVQDLSERLYAR